MGNVTGAKLGWLDPGELEPQTRAALSEIDRIMVYQLPLIHRFRQIDKRDGVLIHGPAGWAEISPFWDYDAIESASWMAAGLQAATEPAPPPQRSTVPVNATIPVVTPEKAAQLVHAAGCTTVKVKVADRQSTLANDCDRVGAVRHALDELIKKAAPASQVTNRPRGQIRVDANAAWSEKQAVEAIKALDRASGGLEYVEQPCASVSELAWVRRHVHVPIAADESIRRAADPLEVVRAQAADLMVVKVQPLGGITRVLELVEETGMQAVVSSALDSSVGLMRSVQCAAALPQLHFACGLATSRLFVEDVTATPLQPQAGAMQIRPISPDESRLADTAQMRDLTLRWKRRLEQITPHLANIATPTGRPTRERVTHVR